MMPNDMAKRVENNHDELNLGQILFMHKMEIKNKIRKLEKSHNVFINNKYGIIFNEIYIYIYIYIMFTHDHIIKNSRKIMFVYCIHSNCIIVVF